MDDQALGLLRQEVVGIFLGCTFLLIGLAACGIAAIRRRNVRLLLWQGLFSAMYGARLLVQVPASFHLLPRAAWGSRVEIISVLTSLILLPALLFFVEMSRAALRRVLQITLVAVAILAAAGVFTAIFLDRPFLFASFNNLLAVWSVGLLFVVNVVPGLARKFLTIQSRVTAWGALLFAAAALYTNLEHLFRKTPNVFVEPLGLAALILALGYLAAEKTFADERRLLSIESELAVAREIQNSILPGGVPELKSLRISAAYRPMAAVAGDFYEFVRVDEHRIGLLIADVTGHGVPAALIASMIKVAMQSVVACADSPREVMRGLDRVLSAQLRGQFVSAAYLWLDTENRRAFYSAAGHPPLLLWNEGKLERIESNGILFGVVPDSDYPVREIPIQQGDRFRLYTDGVIEPENSTGNSFGAEKLEEVVRENYRRPGAEFSEQLLSELRSWQPESTAQQDDITLIVVDVV